MARLWVAQALYAKSSVRIDHAKYDPLLAQLKVEHNKRKAEGKPNPYCDPNYPWDTPDPTPPIGLSGSHSSGEFPCT